MRPVPISIQRILCPTDFSLFSVRALRHAATLARLFRAELTVLHVIPTFPPYGAESPYYSMPVWTGPELRREAEEEMGRFVQSARELGVSLETKIGEGRPAQEIQALATALPADLVVMGTHGQSGFERLLLGSVTERLLHRLSCPVMTVCHEEGRTWEAPGLVRRILCPTDFSESSAQTIAFALSLAAAKQAHVTLFHVIEALPEATAHFPRFPEGFRRELELRAGEHLHDLVPAEARGTVEIEERVTSGRAYREILRAAATSDFDLIVMGIHGRGPLGGMILGSTAHHVVREATCPVLTVRPTAIQKAALAEPTALAG